MLKRILKKLGYFLPTLVIVSLVAFFLSKLAPGDPVAHYVPPIDALPSSSYSVTYYEKQYTKYSRELGLDQPLFYFSLESIAYPDTFHQIILPRQRELLDKLVGQYGNWPEVQNYYRALENLDKLFFQWPDSIAPDNRINFQRTTGQLFYAYEDAPINSLFEQLSAELLTVSQVPYGEQVIALLSVPLHQAIDRYRLVKDAATPHKLARPTFRWHGTNNQYHHWITGFIMGDFGRSIRDRRPVFDKIKEAAWWTLSINIIAIFLAFAISIPIGVYSSSHAHQRPDRIIGFLTFVLFSIPQFWMAMLLVVFLTTPQYGMNWFASVGLGDLSASAPFWDRFWERLSHLILPIFCVTYGTVAFISRQVRGSMLDVIQKDFIRTAFAKGLPRRQVTWHHVFRNALFPLITLIALVFPAALGGSVIVEVIFNIPGMGRLLFDSILGRDWPVVFMVLMIVTVLTILGNLVADVLYGLADPRTRK